MSNGTRITETTNWFENGHAPTDPTDPPQYALVAVRSIDPCQSLTVSLIETIVDVLEPPNGQTSLSLYQYVNPDALEDLVETGGTKKSGVEVRFVIENHLVTVRSNNTVLIYEPLGARRDSDRNPILN
ncbi:hypothetical protein A4G99_15190 [Haladaptatus sp. R4]|uniref:HalOD1 output domain-containing protein n=1 Tax=Haladaptatus sp. R4 TaxID=1679489 RepID=UPI0007B4D3A8|nr:HalOD1 output domain-containing protein [Haladaptatus sp. R4]KZN23359.1 hypothetical protein A4G99_15190 [Haladaptatus sp. R4]